MNSGAALRVFLDEADFTTQSMDKSFSYNVSHWEKHNSSFKPACKVKNNVKDV